MIPLTPKHIEDLMRLSDEEFEKFVALAKKDEKGDN